MSVLNTKISFSYEGKTIAKSWTRNYKESNVIRKTLNSLDAPTPVLKFDESAFGENTLKEAKALIICNEGNATIELVFAICDWTAGAPDAGATNVRKMVTILHPGETIPLPHGKFINYSTATAATNGDNGALDNTLVSAINSGNLYLDSGADVDNVTAAGIVGSATSTTVYLENGHSNYFEVGDLVRVTNEVMEVVAVGTGADLANSTLTVIRGTHGTSAASDHSDNDDILFPFFNAYHEFDKLLKGSSQLAISDGLGRYKSSNFFGKARTAGVSTLGVSGLVPGSLAFKFYTKAYQDIEFAFNVGGGDSSNLTSSTAYAFDITIADSAATTVSFTTGTNVNFGGVGGVISKINDALKVAFKGGTAALEGFLASCALVDGKIRFTDYTNMHPHDGTNGSKILLASGSSGTNLFAGTTGIFPAVADLPTAIEPKLPDDKIYDSLSGTTSTNDRVFMVDDGYGNLIYPANTGNKVGTCDYITGAIDFRINSLPFAEFALNGHYDSAFSGRTISSTNTGNHIEFVYARSVNSKINAHIGIYVYN